MAAPPLCMNEMMRTFWKQGDAELREKMAARSTADTEKQQRVEDNLFLMKVKTLSSMFYILVLENQSGGSRTLVLVLENQSGGSRTLVLVLQISAL